MRSRYRHRRRRKMQFHKLRNLFNLIKLQQQQQCQCHQRSCQRKHKNHLQHHHHHHLKHKASLKRTIILALIALTTVALATSPMQPTSSLLPHDGDDDVKNPDNVVVLPIASSWENALDYDNSNATDNFERTIFEQLKREQKLEENSVDDETSKPACCSSSNSDANYNAKMVTQRKTILSRKRRYLVFPEGSSFQVVYDGIFGVVDYTNYLILGIIVSLAWELPSKPPSEILEYTKSQLQDGTFLFQRNDTIQNISYVDTSPNEAKEENGQRKFYTKKNRLIQPVFMPPMHRNYFLPNYNQPAAYNYIQTTKPLSSSIKYKYYSQPSDARSNSPYYRNNGLNDDFWRRRKHNYYFKKNISHKTLHPFSKWLPHAPPTNANIKYPWWNLNSRLKNAWRRQGTSMQQKQQHQHQRQQQQYTTARQFNNINNNYKRIPQQQQQKRVKQPRKMSNSGYYQSNASPAPPTVTASSETQRTQRKHRIYPVFGKRKRSLPNINIQQQKKSPADISNEQPHLYQRHKQRQEEHRNHQHEHQKRSREHENEHEHENHRHQNHHHHHRHEQRTPQNHQTRTRFRRHGIDTDELSKFDRIHIRHHRHTRHTFYEKIEKYLDKRGSHGHHCVLRALCETGQKSHEQEPGSFLGELMRVLFTLPEPVEEDLHRLEYKESRYDAAHAYTGDCSARYFHCKDSLWKSPLIV